MEEKRANQIFFFFLREYSYMQGTSQNLSFKDILEIYQFATPIMGFQYQFKFTMQNHNIIRFF